MAGKSSCSARPSGCRARVSATKATPGREAAAPGCTTTLSKDMPCAFQGVKAQASTRGTCVLLMEASASASARRGKIGTQSARSG